MFPLPQFSLFKFIVRCSYAAQPSSSFFCLFPFPSFFFSLFFSVDFFVRLLIFMDTRIEFPEKSFSLFFSLEAAMSLVEFCMLKVLEQNLLRRRTQEPWKCFSFFVTLSGWERLNEERYVIKCVRSTNNRPLFRWEIQISQVESCRWRGILDFFPISRNALIKSTTYFIFNNLWV